MPKFVSPKYGFIRTKVCKWSYSIILITLESILQKEGSVFMALKYLYF